MMQLKMLFQFDRKSMGFIFFIPIIIWIVLTTTVLFSSLGTESFYQSLQFVFLPFYCWWVVYRYSELLEDGARETLFKLYKKHILTDIIRFYLVMSLLTGTLFIFYNKGKFDSLQLELLLYSLLLGLNFLIIGVMLLLWTRNVELSIGMIAIYTVVEFATNGQLIPWPHFFYDFNFLVKSEVYLHYIFNCASIVIASAVIRFRLLKY